jgi:maltose O-acetyltransferase
MKTIGSIFGHFLLAMEKSRNKTYYKKYELHPSFCIGERTYLYGPGRIVTKEDGYIGVNSTIYSSINRKVSIGRRVAISHNVRMYTNSYIANQNWEKNWPRLYHEGDIIIGDNVWIGTNVYIGPGVHIGDNTVIGANCVITKDIPRNVIVKHAAPQIIQKA